MVAANTIDLGTSNSSGFVSFSKSDADDIGDRFMTIWLEFIVAHRWDPDLSYTEFEQEQRIRKTKTYVDHGMYIEQTFNLPRR